MFIHQKTGFDSQETFSLVAKYIRMRVIIFLALTFNWWLRHVDVQNAFFHGDRHDIMYMTQTPEFE